MSLGKRDELITNTNSLVLQQVAKFPSLANEHGMGMLAHRIILSEV